MSVFRLDLAFARLITAINAVHGQVGAAMAAIGNRTQLGTTDKSSLVAALNEVLIQLQSLPAGVQINDAATAAGSTWSSTKIQSTVTAAIAALINGSPTASDTLSELASQISALAQADSGLVSTAGAQAFNTAQQLQACTNLGLGNPDHDFVPAITAALNPGL